MDEKDIIIQKQQEQMQAQTNETRALAAALLVALSLLPTKEIVLGISEIDSLLSVEIPCFQTLPNNYLLVYKEVL